MVIYPHQLQQNAIFNIVRYTTVIMVVNPPFNIKVLKTLNCITDLNFVDSNKTPFLGHCERRRSRSACITVLRRRSRWACVTVLRRRSRSACVTVLSLFKIFTARRVKSYYHLGRFLKKLIDCLGSASFSHTYVIPGFLMSVLQTAVFPSNWLLFHIDC